MIYRVEIRCSRCVALIGVVRVEQPEGWSPELRAAGANLEVPFGAEKERALHAKTSPACKGAGVMIAHAGPEDRP